MQAAINLFTHDWVFKMNIVSIYSLWKCHIMPHVNSLFSKATFISAIYAEANCQWLGGATSAVDCNDRSPAATGIRSSLDSQ